MAVYGSGSAMAVQCLPYFTAIDTVIEKSLFFSLFFVVKFTVEHEKCEDSRESYQNVGERRCKRYKKCLN